MNVSKQILAHNVVKMHFVNEDDETITCKDCIDYKTRQCFGRNYKAKECIDCITKHVQVAHRF